MLVTSCNTFVLVCTGDVRIPEKFAFPFDPYDIQVGFMRSLYSVLELGQVGIFESPTGTVR